MTDEEHEELIASPKPVTDVAGTIETFDVAIATLGQCTAAQVMNHETHELIGEIGEDEFHAMAAALAIARFVLMGSETTDSGLELANRLISWYGGLKFKLVGTGCHAGKITVVDDGDAV